MAITVTAPRPIERAEEILTPGPAGKLIAEICLSEDYTDFLTTPAYELVG